MLKKRTKLELNYITGETKIFQIDSMEYTHPGIMFMPCGRYSRARKKTLRYFFENKSKLKISIGFTRTRFPPTCDNNRGSA
jgi:hypothetical protein